jgi:Rad3-related DNA helicase
MNWREGPHAQVPQAVLKLKQGFGQLICTKKDTGMVVILDPRVLTKGYGRMFWMRCRNAVALLTASKSDGTFPPSRGIARQPITSQPARQ